MSEEHFHDYDQQFEEALQEGIKGALGKLSSAELAALAEDDFEQLTSGVKDAVETAVRESVPGLVARLEEDAPAMLENRRVWQREAERAIAQHCQEAFDRYEIVLKSASEIGEFYFEKHKPKDGDPVDLVFAALGRMVARACRIAEQVLVLLKAGYGQGALAQWRSLHEIDVVSRVLAAHDEELAERFFAHEAVESWRAMTEFQEHADALHEARYSDTEVAAQEARFDALLAKYGKRFGDPYGWAQEAMATVDPKFEKGRVFFTDLERAAQIDHMRPYYRMASHGVHSNPKSVLWEADWWPDAPETVLLTGPSPVGFADAGHATLISLTRVVTSALHSKRGAAMPFLIGALLDLTARAGDAFLQAHHRVGDLLRDLNDGTDPQEMRG